MYVVAGVTGRTGRVVADALLEKHQPVRVIVRDARQGELWQKRGAEVAVARLDDVAEMSRALAGAEGAYLLLPPSYDAEDMFAVQRRVSDALAEAVRASHVQHVVLLSSLGAERATGTGPIRGLHYAERTLGAASRNITFLRAGYFFENFAPVLPATQQGVLPTFLSPERRIPMVATADIGRTAAELLLEPAAGTRVVELTASRDWSPADVARELSALLGRALTVQAGPLEAVVPALTGMGMPRGVAESFRQMIDALNRGHISRQGPPAQRREGRMGAGDALRGLLDPARLSA